MHRPCASAMIAATAFAVLVAPATASTLDDHPLSGLPVQITIPAGFEHQFRTDIRRGGDFSVSRGTVGLGVRTPLPAEMNLSMRFTYSMDDYSFRGNGNFGDGWDDIHTLNMGASLSMQLSPDWTIFGGPAFQFARESGASWGDGFIGGGFFGASYRHSDRLTIGGGLGVVSQLEDSARVYPILILEWEINDQLSLTSSTAASATGDTGIELVYQIAGPWETAIGAASRFRRFRLDDNGPAPDGVGQDRSIPVWGRVSYTFNDHFKLNVYAGVNAAGNLRLEDSDGNRIARENYDAAAFVGISGALQF